MKIPCNVQRSNDLKLDSSRELHENTAGNSMHQRLPTDSGDDSTAYSGCVVRSDRRHHASLLLQLGPYPDVMDLTSDSPLPHIRHFPVA